ncbi:hypothetical protein RB195_003015 [Necator americanus]|uniref:Uncharacterized protein n=1 Tax=Necator americanus TaxID=51031 RepID=A0ABR1DM37_NECAM
MELVVEQAEAERLWANEQQRQRQQQHEQQQRSQQPPALLNKASMRTTSEDWLIVTSHLLAYEEMLDGTEELFKMQKPLVNELQGQTILRGQDKKHMTRT